MRSARHVKPYNIGVFIPWWNTPATVPARQGLTFLLVKHFTRVHQPASGEQGVSTMVGYQRLSPNWTMGDLLWIKGVLHGLHNAYRSWAKFFKETVLHDDASAARKG